MPLNFIAVRMAAPLIHPRVLTATSSNLPTQMRITFYVAFLAAVLLWIALWKFELVAKSVSMQLKKLEQDILVQVDNALTALRSAGQRVKSTHQGRIYAEAALDAENHKFEAGMSTVFLVEEMQRLLTTARSAEIRALADYNTAVVQLAFSEGSTLEKNHLQVQVK